MSYIEDLGQQLGTGTATGLLGAAFGQLMAPTNDARQIHQAQGLADIQVAANEKLSDYNYQKQMDMWNATNYGPQVQQLEKAGLNPGLLYAKGGPGGMTNANPGAPVQTGQAQQNPGEAQGIALGIMNQNSLMESQRNLNQAEADKLRSEIPVNKTQEDVNKTLANLNIANTENAQANTALQRVQTDIANLQKQLQGATLQDQITLVGQTVEKTAAEIKQIGLQNQLSEETMDAKIKMATAQLIGQYLTNNLTKAETGQAVAQTKELGARAQSELSQAKAAVSNAITMIDEVWGSDKDGKTVQEHWNAIQKNYTEKLINLGIGAEAIQGIGQILDHIPALNMTKGIPRGTTPPQVQGFRQKF